MRREDTDNQARVTGATGGFVESYFLRANDPGRPRALWLKATALRPLRGEGVAESWFVYFDGERGRTWAQKSTGPLGPRFQTAEGDEVRLEVPEVEWRLGAGGTCEGRAGPEASWSLSFAPELGPVGEPLCLLPSRRLLETGFPKSKLLTPQPALVFDGRVRISNEEIDVRGWQGMQGHNWGREHAAEYAWGQCYFARTGRSPASWVEGFTARVALGPVKTPPLSAMVVRHGAELLRFDRLVDLWRQRATVSETRWCLSMRGGDGEAELELDASGRPLACLGYANPNGRLSYCMNSKLARARLRVRPARGAPFELESAHGGALEFLRGTPAPGLEVV